jgi:hypothetical protein
VRQQLRSLRRVSLLLQLRRVQGLDRLLLRKYAERLLEALGQLERMLQPLLALCLVRLLFLE